jgi:hypothetical protein
MPEIRVPPYGSEQDDWAINERYDAFKFFEESGRQVGVAIEMEGWQINNDLLKFPRGFSRGQICAGVLLQPDLKESRQRAAHSDGGRVRSST